MKSGKAATKSERTIAKELDTKSAKPNEKLEVVTAYSSGIVQACSTDLAAYFVWDKWTPIDWKEEYAVFVTTSSGLERYLKSEHDLAEGIVIPEGAFRHTAISLKSIYSHHVSSAKISTSPGPSGITTVHRI
ncbi:8158_t:CDS:2 [Paraglomus occultum]|uniref:8158_t:CDS:1 n=1 Tax=Paraglomus occultum TaxID=144539 RepID=A0A9N9C8A3_9GLOM|nr:8158_t:CDS:2 [Paraglomus occultum]